METVYASMSCMLFVHVCKISNFSVLSNIWNSAKVDAVVKTCSALRENIKEEERNKE